VRRAVSAAMEHLELNAVIGFAGSVVNGLILLPDRKSMVYALGSTIVRRDIVNPKDQQFLQGHSDRVTCMALSPSGKYLASGQVTHLGFQADVIVWDMETLEIVHRLRLHKVRVEAVAFSCNDKWLASIGGEDDNSLVVWNLETGKAVCGSPAANDVCHTVKFARNNEFVIITAGKTNLRVWDFDLANRKVRPTDCNLGKLQRTIKYVQVDENDEFCYAGTASGDVLKVNMRTKLFKHIGPRTRMPQGVCTIDFTPSGDLLIGGGDGTLAIMHAESLKILQSTKLDGGGIMGLAPHTSGQLFFVSTSQCSTYVVKYEGLQAELRSTCHSTRIHDVVYPQGYSELFATCSKQDIRVWNSRTCAELLRIQIPNLDCNCISFSKDGRAVISGWSDGKIRAFGP
jgi:WD40 repeat protein